MDPTEFDEFDSLLREERWDSAFQVGWRVLHRLVRSFYVNLTMCGQNGTDEEKRSTALKIDREDEDVLFSRWGKRLTSVDIQQEIDRVSPSLWVEYQRAKQLRHFVFHGKLYMQQGFNVRTSAEALRRMLAVMDQLFEADPGYAHVRKGGPLPPIADFSFDENTRTLTIDLDGKFHKPDIRR